MLAAQDTFRGFGPLIFIAFVLCAVVSYAMMAQLYRVLRERHPAVYDSLGQPGSFWNNSMKNSFAVLAFILGGRFRETHDLEVVRLCRFIPWRPELVLLHPGCEICVQNCRDRPHEAHKYPTKEEQDRRLSFLLQWVSDYYERDGPMSLRGHLDLFKRYDGAKRIVTDLNEA